MGQMLKFFLRQEFEAMANATIRSENSEILSYASQTSG